ncbi:MAG: DUF3455 domain-containing protein [Vicinamibacterales bacterium]
MSSRFALAAAAFTAALTVVTHAADRPSFPSVPVEIAVPAGVRPFFVAHAAGTQNYICAPAATPGGLDWLAIGPQATGFDREGDQVLTHYLSKNPFQNGALHATWQHSRDTSAVWAAKLAGSSDPAYVAAGAVEWLLLAVTGAQDGPAGGDKVSRARYIQRVNTAGGVKPPSTDCTAATVTTRRLVDYTADYYFFR